MKELSGRSSGGAVALFLVIGLVSGGFAGYFLRMSMGEELTLRREADTLRLKVQTLQAEISAKQTEITRLEADNAYKNGQISALVLQLADKSSQIMNLTSQISRLNEDLAKDKALILQLRGEIAALNETLHSIKTGAYFSPNGGCQDQLIDWIAQANESIHVMVYSFSLQPVADALIAAENRGVEVKVVFELLALDQFSVYPRLKSSGLDVRVDTNVWFMHNKVMIVDGRVVLTGSYDWTPASEGYNNENLITILDDDIAQLYEQQFQSIWSTSQLY